MFTLCNLIFVQSFFTPLIFSAVYFLYFPFYIYWNILGETEELVVVLGGPKGHAYKVSLNVSDLLTATITPLDKHNKPDASKAVTVSPIAVVYLCS